MAPCSRTRCETKKTIFTGSSPKSPYRTYVRYYVSQRWQKNGISYFSLITIIFSCRELTCGFRRSVGERSPCTVLDRRKKKQFHDYNTSDRYCCCVPTTGRRTVSGKRKILRCRANRIQQTLLLPSFVFNFCKQLIIRPSRPMIVRGQSR